MPYATASILTEIVVVLSAAPETEKLLEQVNREAAVPGGTLPARQRRVMRGSGAAPTRPDVIRVLHSGMC